MGLGGRIRKFFIKEVVVEITGFGDTRPTAISL